MGSVTGYTAGRMKEIEDTTVVSGAIEDGHLILQTRAGDPIDAGDVTGPEGPAGPSGTPPTADELAYWQDQAALLDPSAYEYVMGANFVRTVPAGQTWYLVNGWYMLPMSGAGPQWFHRPSNVNRALALPAGTIINGTTNTASFAYFCKPSLVVPGDARYTDDPKGLYYDRIRRLQTELPRFQIGAAATNSGTVPGIGQISVNFPTDFTKGFLLHTSTHDIAWIILKPGGINTHNEISDADGIRWAEDTPAPFLRTQFTQVLLQGVGMPQGAGVITYVKLPADW